MPLRPSPSRRRASSSLVTGIAAAVGVAAAVGGVVAAHRLGALGPVIGRLLPYGEQLHDRGTILGILALWSASYVVLGLAVSRLPRVAGTALALAAGLAACIASIATSAVLSDDLYRYAWDGRVQAAGINPYRYAPDDPHLVALRDTWLFPTADGCAARGRMPGCTLMNRPSVHTIYPPLAQAWFRILHAVMPGAHDRGYEIAGLFLVVVATALLLAVLLRLGRDPRWIVVWAGCPAVAIEAVQSAHVDTLAVVGVLAAVLAAASGRWLLAGLGVAAGGLVKLYPLGLLPAIAWRRRVAAWLLAIVVFAASYLPFLPGVGSGVAGYLAGYLHEEGYSDGSRFLLLRVVGITGTAAKVVVVLALVAVVVAAAVRRLGPPDVAALTILLVLGFLSNPGEPWGDLVTLALMAVTRRWEWVGLLAAEYAQYLFALLHHDGHYRLVATSSYAIALVIGLAVTAVRVQRGPAASTLGAGRQAAWA